jgi:CHAT domain-containing protein
MLQDITSWGSLRNVIERVISSYTPTIKALAYSRERIGRAANLKSQKAVIVGMPETPNQHDLPHVATEIKWLIDILSPCIETTVLHKATKESVLSVLRDHQIVHFSCHGYSAADNPSEGSLLLDDWQNSPLTVSDLTALDIPLPQFAYLSACHSASSRDFRLLNESINLSSAIQLAGYPSVLGTLWQVSDEDSAKIARDVYAWMLVGTKLETERSADGLHHAVHSLRERTRVVQGFTKKVPESDPLVWAPYIHLGV